MCDPKNARCESCAMVRQHAICKRLKPGAHAGQLRGDNGAIWNASKRGARLLLLATLCCCCPRANALSTHAAGNIVSAGASPVASWPLCAREKVGAAIRIAQANGAQANGAQANGMRVAELNEAVPEASAPVPTVGAHFSLKVHDAPLSQVLRLMESMTPLRFRYGALPDAVISLDADNVPLLPTLQNVLAGAGWQMRLAQSDVFLLRAAPPTPNSPSFVAPAFVAPAFVAPDVQESDSSWVFWNGMGAPPARWMTLDKPRLKSSSPASNANAGTNANADANAVVNASSAASIWRAAALEVEANVRPGVQVFQLIDAANVGGTARAEEAASAMESTSGAWARWSFSLSFVPRGARLLVDTPEKATLYVNGAPLLTRWSGLRSIDLSLVLRRGDNRLAIAWPRLSRAFTTLAPTPTAAPTEANPDGAANRAAGETNPIATDVASKAALTPATGARPILRYEWLCEDGRGETFDNNE